MTLQRRALAAGIAGLALIAALTAARPHPEPQASPTARPHVSGEAPKPASDLRRRNSLVMDVDFAESAAAINSDVIDIAGTLQLILDRIAAQTAPTNDFGEPRSIVWVPLNGDKECHDGTDAGILELRLARFVGRQQNFIFIGHQVEEADLAFRIFDCSGREILHYPLDESSPYGEGRFAPYFLSLTGTAGVIALANAHSNNSSIAATLAVINNYSTLQANIGAHDGNNMRLLALYRLVGNIPGSAVPPPDPGTVAALLATCVFQTDPDGIIRLHCAP
ncbi:MAG: hypothetical protein ABSB70_21245 [Candidatus Velthaea sp.]